MQMLAEVWNIDLLDDITRVVPLSVRVWAHAAVTQGGFERLKTAALELNLSHSRSSTVSKYLKHGSPRPSLRQRDGSRGAILAFEQFAHGSARILFHPIWPLLALPRHASDIDRLVSDLDPAVVRRVKTSTLARAVVADFTMPYENAMRLATIGSLDALTGYLALVLKTHMPGDLQGLVNITPNEKVIRNWTALRDLPNDLRESIGDLAIHLPDRYARLSRPVAFANQREDLARKLIKAKGRRRTADPEAIADLVAILERPDQLGKTG